MPSDRKSAPWRRPRSRVVRRKRKKKWSIPKGLFAKTTKMAFRYCDTITLNPGPTGVAAYHTFSCNGMFDPDITGVGHQPRGFDQYMQFYNHYTVIGAKITATFINLDSGQSAAANCYVAVGQGSGPTPVLTNMQDIREKRDALTKVQTVSGTRPRYIKSSVNLSKALAQKVLQEDANAGTASANPSEQWYFYVMAASIDGTDPSATSVAITVDYIAILHEPKDITGS